MHLAIEHPMTAAAFTPAWIALGIAVATPWTMFWSVWQNRRTTRPRLKGRAAPAYPVFPVGPIKPYLSVTAANTGPVPLTLNSVTLAVRGRTETLAVSKWLWQSPEQLPTRLDPGAGYWTGFADLDELARTLNDTFGKRDEWHVRAILGAAGDLRFLSGSWRWWRPWQTRWTRISGSGSTGAALT